MSRGRPVLVCNPRRITKQPFFTIRHVGSSTVSWDTRCPTSSGRKSGADSPPAASRRSPCGSSASARARSRRSSRSSTGRSTPTSRPGHPRRSRRSSFRSRGRSSSSTGPIRVSNPKPRPHAFAKRRSGPSGGSRKWTPRSGARTRRPLSSPRSSSRPRRAVSGSPCAGRCRSRSASTRGARSRVAGPSV